MSVISVHVYPTMGEIPKYCSAKGSSRQKKPYRSQQGAIKANLRWYVMYTARRFDLVNFCTAMWAAFCQRKCYSVLEKSTFPYFFFFFPNILASQKKIYKFTFLGRRKWSVACRWSAKDMQSLLKMPPGTSALPFPKKGFFGDFRPRPQRPPPKKYRIFVSKFVRTRSPKRGGNVPQPGKSNFNPT